MEWKDWIGKKVFLRTKNHKVYSGIVETIDESSPPLIFIYLTDKFDQMVTLVHSEIVEIKEEEER